MAAESRRNFSLLSKAFSGKFFPDFYPSRAQLKFNGKRKPQFPSVKVHAPENPYKNGEFSGKQR